MMFLMLVTLAAGITRSSSLICCAIQPCVHKPFLVIMLFFFLLPAAALDQLPVEALLRFLAPLRGAAALLFMAALLLSGLIRSKKSPRKEADS